ncbi:MAG: hypothetical protein KJ000_32935 [Pirellulaceae bacterium]|nr:hypothetical protein [Pirellulaceae bacterium]
MAGLLFTANLNQRSGCRAITFRCWPLLALLALAAVCADCRDVQAQTELLAGNCCLSRRVGLNICSPHCQGCVAPLPHRRGNAGPCGCGPQSSCPSCLEKPPADDQSTAPPSPEPQSPSLQDEPFPPDTDFEGVGASFGASARTSDVASMMIGDFFGGGQNMFLPSLGSDFVSVLPVGGGDRRMKLSENNSPFPVDRVFVNFNHFQNAVRDVNNRQFSLQRYTFGIEKTFFNGASSAEVRLPFAYGLDATQAVGTPSTNSATELGNLALIFKQTLWRTETWAAAAGVALTLPTAARAVITGGGNTVTVDNESCHLLPYLGLHYTPNDRFWTQAFVQADFDTTGNTVVFSGPAFGNTTPLPGVDPSVRGVLQDQSVLFMDIAWGYWLVRNRSHGWISGIAPIVELHYSTSMQDGDVVFSPNGDAVGGFDTLPDGETPGGQGGDGVGRRLDILNLTAAVRLEIASRSLLTLAAVAPLRTGSDQPFDAEFSVQYVWLY